MAFDMTHTSLNTLAARWLKRPRSAKGPGCSISLIEVGGRYGGERADAWGYSLGTIDGSVLVESKVSRADFLADAKKPHRSGEVLGIGTYRYYLCPEEVIQLDDLPEKWGLLWVNKRGHIKVKAGHVLDQGHCSYTENAVPWQHTANKDVELEIMAHLLNRLGDIEALNRKFRDFSSENSRLATKVNTLHKSNRELARYKQRYLWLKNKMNGDGSNE